jgi:O-acetylhomoserine/O-acetylserine sulfhydrylase-like pyridoxal-dependent enzyme
VFESFDDGVARFAGESQDPICSRQGNPTPSLSPFNGFLLHQGIETL